MKNFHSFKHKTGNGLSAAGFVFKNAGIMQKMTLFL